MTLPTRVPLEADTALPTPPGETPLRRLDIDGNGRIRECTPAAAQLFGCERGDELVGTHFASASAIGKCALDRARSGQHPHQDAEPLRRPVSGHTS